MDKNIIEKALAAFSFGRIQDFMTMHGVMRRNNISMADLEGYINGEKARRGGEMEAFSRLREKMPACPECGEKLVVRSINLPKGPRNRNGWKSLWCCIGGDCVYEDYSIMTVEEQQKKNHYSHKATTAQRKEN